MIDFYNNTYVVRRTEKDVVIKILKKHPEYRGFGGKYEFNQRGIDQDNYDFLWKQIDDTFNDYSDEEFVYLDNEYITDSNIRHQPWLIGLAEVYTNDDYVQHKPKPLLPELKKLGKQLMKVE
jgi:hypothetical protein